MIETTGSKEALVVLDIRKLDWQMHQELELQRPGKTQQVNITGIETQNPVNKRLKKSD